MKQLLTSPLSQFILILLPSLTTACGTYIGSAAYQVFAPTPATVAIRAEKRPIHPLLDAAIDPSTNKFWYTLRFYEAQNGAFFFRIKNSLPLQGCTVNCIQFFKEENDDLVMDESENQGACFQYQQDGEEIFALSLGIPSGNTKSFVQFDNTDLRFETMPISPVFWWMLPQKENGAGQSISPLQAAFQIPCRKKRSTRNCPTRDWNSGRSWGHNRYRADHSRCGNSHSRRGPSRTRSTRRHSRGSNNHNNNNNNKDNAITGRCGTEEIVAVHNIVQGGSAANLGSINFRSNVSNPDQFLTPSTQFEFKQFLTYNTPLRYDRRRKQYFLTAYETVAIRIPESPWYLESEEGTRPARGSRVIEDEIRVIPPSRMRNFGRTTGSPLNIMYSPIGFGKYDGKIKRPETCRQSVCTKTPSVTGVNITSQQHVDRRMFRVHRNGNNFRLESILSPGIFLAFLKRDDTENLILTRPNNDRFLLFDFNAKQLPPIAMKHMPINMNRRAPSSRSTSNGQRRRRGRRNRTY